MDDVKRWKDKCTQVLKAICSLFLIRPEDIANECGYDVTAVRKWLNGSRFPRQSTQLDLIDYFTKKTKKINTLFPISYIRERIVPIFAEFGLQHVQAIANDSKEDVPAFIEAILHYSFSCLWDCQARSAEVSTTVSEAPAKQITKAIVFDFDGTLTTCKANRTTWEDIWVKLGYGVELCQKYHKMFDSKSITHKQWCTITEDFFKQRGMNLQILKDIAKEITLMPGIEEFMEQMHKHDIKMYIVSGSIFYVIRYALGPYYSNFDGIKANQFIFNEDESLQEIVGTEYDFEGKAEYIRKISRELNINPASILFVGNSLNDQYAHESGARTLCINPKRTDSSNKSIWHDCLENCTDLTEIMPFIVF